MKYDLVILGGGAAGFAAAIKASELNAKTAMIEGNLIGGTCVNVGCVPTKYLLNVGEIYRYAKIHNFGGIELEPSLNFEKVVMEKNKLVKELRREKYANILSQLEGVDFYQKKGVFLSKNEVKVGDKVLHAKKFIVATGSSPNIISVRGIEEVDYLTNSEALNLEDLPESMIVIGGRALGLEFAQMYSNFGTKVILLQRSKMILPEEEPEISYYLKKFLEEDGVKIYTGVSLKRVRKKGKYKVMEAEVEGKIMEFEGEKLLLATGRNPNTSNFSLENTGVKVGRRGEILVDKRMQTSVPNIFAAGDVRGKPMLETVAAREGFVACENALASKGIEMDYSAIPHAIFTSPQAASVGLTDRMAIELGYKCRCSTIDFSLVPKALILNRTKGIIKMVVEDSTERILGVHILSHNASELIHEAVFALKYKLKIDDVVETVHVFPTLSEAIKLVAQSFKKDVTKLSCCVE